MSTTQIEDISEFTYETLPESGSYIRLLTGIVIDATQPVAIRCQLTTWRISEAPRYHAISYTWGDADHPATILINGARKQVSRNCEYTLKQAKWYGGDVRRRYYWVDAICIDQSSNEEKGPQVAIMGQVFRNAERVMACVGEHDKASKYLYRILRRDLKLFKEISKFRLQSLDLREHTPSQQWAMSKQRSTFTKQGESLFAFIERPYFWRVWIYQELSLGRQVSVCCGKDHLPVHSFWGFTTLITFLEWGAPGTGSYHDMREKMYLVSRSIWSPAVAVNSLTTLAEALLHVSPEEMKCADPRDRIYGILSTVDWSKIAPIYPDYTKDRLEVATEALRAITKNGSWKSAWLWFTNVTAKNLDLLDDISPQLGEAIQSRRINCSGQKASINQKLGFEAHACGFRLAYQDGKWKVDGSTVAPCRHFVHRGQVVPELLQTWPEYLESRGTLRIDDGCSVLLPRVTQPGDWIILPYGYSDLLLIARQRDDGRFDLVGKGLVGDGTMENGTIPHEIWGERAGFMLHLDVEDAIVLFATKKQVDPISSHLPNDVIIGYLETRVCGQPGSSYAEWDFD